MDGQEVINVGSEYETQNGNCKDTDAHTEENSNYKLTNYIYGAGTTREANNYIAT
jgi:hypothetical protein